MDNKSVAIELIKIAKILSAGNQERIKDLEKRLDELMDEEEETTNRSMLVKIKDEMKKITKEIDRLNRPGKADPEDKRIKHVNRDGSVYVLNDANDKPLYEGWWR